MTDVEILKKAVEKAIENGWDGHIFSSGQPVCGVDLEWWLSNHRYFRIIFNHDFAKAFWGEVKSVQSSYTIQCDDGIGGQSCPLESWQYHLQQMALKVDPIKYLEKFLCLEKV